MGGCGGFPLIPPLWYVWNVQLVEGLSLLSALFAESLCAVLSVSCVVQFRRLGVRLGRNTEQNSSLLSLSILRLSLSFLYLDFVFFALIGPSLGL